MVFSDDGGVPVNVVDDGFHSWVLDAVESSYPVDHDEGVSNDVDTVDVVVGKAVWLMSMVCKSAYGGDWVGDCSRFAKVYAGAGG